MEASLRSGRVLAALLAGVAGAAVLIAGCSTSRPLAGRRVTKTAASSSEPAASTSPATPATAAGPGACKSSVVSVLLGNAITKAATTFYPIVFENLSATNCTLYGFPAISFTRNDFSTRVGPAAAMNQGSPEHLITLQPEGTARALISVVNARNYSSSCGQTAVTGLLVQPPSLTNTVRLPFNGMTCLNPKFHVLTVDAVVLGPALLDGD
jgi:uncharacterized protein DUF4232